MKRAACVRPRELAIPSCWVALPRRRIGLLYRSTGRSRHLVAHDPSLHRRSPCQNSCLHERCGSGARGTAPYPKTQGCTTRSKSVPTPSCPWPARRRPHAGCHRRLRLQRQPSRTYTPEGAAAPSIVRVNSRGVVWPIGERVGFQETLNCLEFFLRVPWITLVVSVHVGR